MLNFCLGILTGYTVGYFLFWIRPLTKFEENLYNRLLARRDRHDSRG